MKSSNVNLHNYYNNHIFLYTLYKLKWVNFSIFEKHTHIGERERGSNIKAYYNST